MSGPSSAEIWVVNPAAVRAVLEAALSFEETESALSLTNKKARALVRAVRKLRKASVR